MLKNSKAYFPWLLKGCSTLARDRFKSLEKRGLIVPTAKSSRFVWLSVCNFFESPFVSVELSISKSCVVKAQLHLVLYSLYAFPNWLLTFMVSFVQEEGIKELFNRRDECTPSRGGTSSRGGSPSRGSDLSFGFLYLSQFISLGLFDSKNAKCYQ